MKLSKASKWVTFGYEAFLGIPILGGAFILLHGWTPLLIAFILHLIALIFSIRANTSKTGNILGLITSVLGVIPVLGFIMHIGTAFVLLISAIKEN